jgi:hypothetical protein
MEVGAKFSLDVRRRSVLSVALDDPSMSAAVPTVSELDLCGFSVSRPGVGDEYQIRIGDETPDDAAGQDFGQVILWKHTAYFESARGRVLVQLLSRVQGTSTEWRRRAQFLVNVLPSKLGEERYDAMFEDLRAVSVGLVFDLLSKSRLKLGLSGIGALSSRPANADLAVLERLWASVSTALQQIALQPMVGLRQVREMRPSWGSERFSEIGLRQLAAAGVDPRKSNMPRPFYAVRDRLRETFDIPEHRTILGFLRFLQDRVVDCSRRAEEHVLAIQRERSFRDIDQADGSNLFRDIDTPRMQRLQVASGRAKELVDRIREAERLDFLQALVGELRVPYSPIFSNVLPYRRFRDEMLRYLGASLAILDEGVEERAKSTGRMYEQWIFLQVLAALRACGLSPLSQQGLLTRSRRHRFTIDIERGTRVSFRCPDGRTVDVRYEPWIHPAALARSAHDTVYRGRSGENSWSPDVLIEVLTDPGDRTKPACAEYAIVIDAKYTSRINQRHQDGVRKNNEIRGTDNDRPVVMQVWLAHPSEDGIAPWDEAVEWTALGPSRPRDEVVNGTLGVMPPAGPPAAEGESPVNEVVFDFAKGILAYLNIKAAEELLRTS